MTDIEDVQSWMGAEIVDPDDAKVGKLDELFVDVRTGAPAYGIAKSGLLGKRHAFPFEGATFSRGHVRTSYPKAVVDSSPTVGDRTITYGDQATLVRHYGLDDDGNDGEPDHVRFASTAALADRRQRVEEELRKAHDVEQQAIARDREAAALMAEANERARRATELTTERDRLAAEAAELRAHAERRMPPA